MNWKGYGSGCNLSWCTIPASGWGTGPPIITSIMIVVYGPRSDLGPPEYETEVLSIILQYALQRKLNLIFYYAMLQNI